LTHLAQLLEKDLITREEFERAKGVLLNSTHRTGFGSGTLKK
jgi:BMFP domain-containing protein YqiC